jgi:hypothetical protein
MQGPTGYAGDNNVPNYGANGPAEPLIGPCIQTFTITENMVTKGCEVNTNVSGDKTFQEWFSSVFERNTNK